jgi:hypothetical protein
MSETIQRYLAAEADMTESDEGQYVLLFDHESALAAAQAEVERLKGVHAAIAGWISDNIEWKDEEELKVLATGFGWIDELRGMAWEEIEAKKAENAALKRDLEEARARQDQVLKALCWRLDVPRCEDFWKMVLQEAATLRPAIDEARLNARDYERDSLLLHEILRDKGGLALKVWTDRQSMRKQRDQLQSRVVELESRLKNE